MAHVSVLKEEVIKYLSPRPGEKFIDGTCGAAGHAEEILKNIGPEGKILCLDLDACALSRAKEKLKNWNQLVFINGNFADLEKTAKENDFFPVDGILVDLGMSSDQLEQSGRGFSFLKDEALDMRFSLDQKIAAREIVNQWPEAELEKILKEYGEEQFFRQIAKAMVRSRKIKPILTTSQLVEAISQGVPQRCQHGRTNFATKTFQALRIAVNDELGSLERFLPQALQVLNKGGRLVIISFHSLEDRIVKNFFREQAKEGRVEILTKKPVIAQFQELSLNPRSRSAKLRAVKKNK